MIEKMITSKAVIAKVIADLGLEENDIKITDMKCWICEAVSKIGTINQLEQKVAIIKLENYQCQLPAELEKLQFVAFSFNSNSGWIPMKKSTGIFSVYDRIEGASSNPEMIIQDSALIALVKSLYNISTDKDALAKLNSDSNIRLTLSALINQYTVTSNNTTKNTNFSNTVQYDVKPGYIYSNVPEGYVKISYLTPYHDEEGLPLIPDKPSYFEAIYWYIAMKLLYIDYFTGRKPQHIYYDAKRSWNFYRQQAYAECLMPNENEIENIKNTWHTLMPEIESYSTYFSTTGDRQNIYNWN